MDPNKTFFGLTTLGPNDAIKDTVKVSEEFQFHELSEEDYVSLFNRHLLGDNALARTLQVDGSTQILRAQLGDMLKELLGRQPRKVELSAWFTHLDFDRAALMGLDEFMAGIRRLCAFSAAQAKPLSQTSYDAHHVAWTKHTRVAFDPQGTYKQPLTSTQEVGWHAAKPAPPSTSPSYGSKHTDVTIKEGRTMTTYYGHYICPP